MSPTQEQKATDALGEIEDAILNLRTMGVGAHSIMHSVVKLAMGWQTQEPSFLAKLAAEIDERAGDDEADAPVVTDGMVSAFIAEAARFQASHAGRAMQSEVVESALRVALGAGLETGAAAGDVAPPKCPDCDGMNGHAHHLGGGGTSWAWCRTCCPLGPHSISNLNAMTLRDALAYAQSEFSSLPRGTWRSRMLQVLIATGRDALASGGARNAS